jgi:transcriptional regulator with XRE-family HTH domain
MKRLVRARQLADSTHPRRLRQAAGLSLADLAEMIEVEPASLSRWETGQGRPRRESALRWLDALEALEALVSIEEAAGTATSIVGEPDAPDGTAS